MKPQPLDPWLICYMAARARNRTVEESTQLANGYTGECRPEPLDDDMKLKIFDWIKQQPGGEEASKLLLNRVYENN